MTTPTPLQWGRGLSTPEMVTEAEAVRWLIALQWGRGLSTPEMRGSGSGVGQGSGPSMGPGSFDPGNPARFRGRPDEEKTFNGAGVFRPRKCSGRASGFSDKMNLQWGRGLSTPEIGEWYEDGNWQPPLQWGRGLSTPEMRSRQRISRSEKPPSMGPGSFDPGNVGE